jgi:hypothetical protein
MLVLMKYPTGSVASSYVKAGDLGRGRERYGQRLERAGVGDALVRPVRVVELPGLPQGVQKVGPVPDQRAIQELAPAGLHPPLHDRVHRRHPDPAEYSFDARVSEDGIEWAVAPRILILRLACSITASTRSHAPDRVTCGCPKLSQLSQPSPRQACWR